MKIKKNDKVLIISGKDKGRKGKVIEAFPQKNSVVVEGMNMSKNIFVPRNQEKKGKLFNSLRLLILPTLRLFVKIVESLLE